MAGNPPSVLVIDVGNTSTALGLYVNGRVLRRTRLATAEADTERVRAKVRQVLGRGRPAGTALSSVVPPVNQRWRKVLRGVGGRLIEVSWRLNLGIPITYPQPETIGADRLANACGAAARYGTPVIVADFGTALTFDVVDRTKGYVGGVIAPGLPLMFSYLAEKTALLPRIGPGPVRHGVGKSTIEAMRLGAVWGYRGLVKEVLRELRKSLGSGVTFCATGGYASWVLKGTGWRIPVDEDLTLYGLGRIFELNA